MLIALGVLGYVIMVFLSSIVVVKVTDVHLIDTMGKYDIDEVWATTLWSLAWPLSAVCGLFFLSAISIAKFNLWVSSTFFKK